MKDGSNVLFEGNIVDIPPGSAPINSAFSTDQDGTAPWVACNNNVFRNNLFRGLGRMVTVQTYPYHPAVHPVGTLTVTNNLFDGTSRDTFMDTGAPDGTGSGWVVTHNTVRGITKAIMFQLNTGPSPTTPNVTFRDNIVTSGGYFFNPSDAYPGKVEDHNVVINTSGASAPSYMSADFLVTSDAAVGFVNVTGADTGGDYHGYALASTSPFKGRASDGTDPGVNFVTLDAALGGGGGGGTTASSTGGSSGLAAPTNLVVK
jgi:hypothetical protein